MHELANIEMCENGGGKRGVGGEKHHAERSINDMKPERFFVNRMPDRLSRKITGFDSTKQVLSVKLKKNAHTITIPCELLSINED